MIIFIEALGMTATVHEVLDMGYWCQLSDGESWAQVPFSEARTVH